jgi:hypothetical protein
MFSAKGADSFLAWGNAPGYHAKKGSSAEGATHFSALPGALSRAFSADASCD